MAAVPIDAYEPVERMMTSFGFPYRFRCALDKQLSFNKSGVFCCCTIDPSV